MGTLMKENFCLASINGILSLLISLNSFFYPVIFHI